MLTSIFHWILCPVSTWFWHKLNLINLLHSWRGALHFFNKKSGFQLRLDDFLHVHQNWYSVQVNHFAICQCDFPPMIEKLLCNPEKGWKDHLMKIEVLDACDSTSEFFGLPTFSRGSQSLAKSSMNKSSWLGGRSIVIWLIMCSGSDTIFSSF